MKRRFEEFNDGVAIVCTPNDDDKLEIRFKGLRFGNENVSVTRHYAARAADTRADKVIHILKQTEIKPHDVVVIGEDQYDVDKVDQIKETMPPITRLTLVEFEKHRKKEFV